MRWRQLFRTKSLELLHAEMLGDNRLRRVLGPVGLTSLGVGAIIGAGIFVMTGRVAANEAGPAILLSYVVAALACGLAAFCYAEFASLAPVAGSAYTYAYATLGELLAWIIGWDLILEYAMSAATVAAAWAQYYNEFLETWFGFVVIDELCHDPFSHPGAWFNLPAVLILLAITSVLVLGIRESAFSNTTLVVIKIGVVVFVIFAGIPFVTPSNWWGIPASERKQAIDLVIPAEAAAVSRHDAGRKPGQLQEERAEELAGFAEAVVKLDAVAGSDTARASQIRAKYATQIPEQKADVDATVQVIARAAEAAPQKAAEKWGLLGHIGINTTLAQLDDATRSNFMPYGISGVMLGAALVFFAFLGFDSVSTHAEEAIRPQRDVPIGILGSLVICTVLYLGVSAVIVGMVPYPDIDTRAAVASAFTGKSNLARGLIALGGLAGMTSVLLITFLSQARIFLAMARDGLLPQNVFGVIHEKYRTPHVSTMITGALMMVVAALTPIEDLEEMVNIGTFFAFVVVCAAVMILRIKRPDAPRPFRCPALFVVAPLGIFINVAMMLFLAPVTWMRLLVWLAFGLALYFAFGYRHSALARSEQATRS